jgi:hypothetical protein
MSQDIEDTVNPRWVTVFSFSGRVACRWAGSCGWGRGSVRGGVRRCRVDDADVLSAGLGRVEAVPAFADGRHDLGDPGVEGVKFFRLGRVGDERTSVA